MKAAKILVVGSAHLDVLAKFSESGQESAVDKIGSSIDFGFGGSALNIAAWLQELGHKPYLLTAINKSSFTGQAVLNAMRAGGLSRKYVIDDPQLPDSAFVAEVSERSLHSAVSYMGVGESGRIIGRFRAIVSRFEWVVLDCNLSYDMIGEIADICARRSIALVCVATSDVKARRLIATQSHGSRAMCMNRREASSIMSEISIPADGWAELRIALNCSTLLVTAGNAGWHLATESEVTHYPPPVGVVPETTVGAGDATCAGLINAIVRGQPVPGEVNRVVARALRSRFSTGFSERTSPNALQQFVRKRRIRNITLAVLIMLAAAVAGRFVELALNWLWQVVPVF